MNIFKKYKIRKKLNQLKHNSEYAINQMEVHEHDSDDTEWKSWFTLNTMYLIEILRLRAQLEE